MEMKKPRVKVLMVVGIVVAVISFSLRAEKLAKDVDLAEGGAIMDEVRRDANLAAGYYEQMNGILTTALSRANYEVNINGEFQLPAVILRVKPVRQTTKEFLAYIMLRKIKDPSDYQRFLVGSESMKGPMSDRENRGALVPRDRNRFQWTRPLAQTFDFSLVYDGVNAEWAEEWRESNHLQEYWDVWEPFGCDWRYIRPSDVRSVIIEPEPRHQVIGKYGDVFMGGDASRSYQSVCVVDLQSLTVVAANQFVGDPPPSIEVVKGSGIVPYGSATGDADVREKMITWIRTCCTNWPGLSRTNTSTVSATE